MEHFGEMEHLNIFITIPANLQILPLTLAALQFRIVKYIYDSGESPQITIHVKPKYIFSRIEISLTVEEISILGITRKDELMQKSKRF